MGYSANSPLDALFRPGPLRRSARRITKRSVEAIRDGARRRSPVAPIPEGLTPSQFAGGRGRTPGTLKASWYSTDVDESVSAAGTPRFGADALTDDPIAPHVEWPTRPHLIRPRLDRAAASVLETGKARRGGGDPQAALRYISRTGRVVFAREVHHPGTQGQHMMRDSLAEVDGTWAGRIGDEEVARWAREQAELVRV